MLVHRTRGFISPLTAAFRGNPRTRDLAAPGSAVWLLTHRIHRRCMLVLPLGASTKPPMAGVAGIPSTMELIPTDGNRLALWQSLPKIANDSITRKPTAFIHPQ